MIYLWIYLGIGFGLSLIGLYIGRLAFQKDLKKAINNNKSDVYIRELILEKSAPWYEILLFMVLVSLIWIFFLKEIFKQAVDIIEPWFDERRKNYAEKYLENYKNKNPEEFI